MLKKASSRVSRLGLKSSKAMFTIKVSKVSLPTGAYHATDGPISVCFERGGKMASTSEKDPTRSDTCFSVEFDEKLSLLATLYGNDQGEYQEKRGKIIVRQHQTGFLKTTSFKVLGRVVLDLRFVANRSETNVLILPLEGPYEGGTVEVTIQGEILADNYDENDETMSLGSDSSSGTLASILGLNSVQGSAGSFGLGPTSVAAENEMNSSVSSSSSRIHPNGDEQYDNNSVLNISNGSVTQDAVDSSEISQRDYISKLEMKLLRLQQHHLDEKRRMKEQFESYKATATKQIQDLSKELFQLKDKRTITEKLRDSLSISTSTKAKQSAIDSAISVDKDSMNEKMKSLSEALASAIASTEAEGMLRCRKEEELEELMEELIDVKVRYAHVASELDVERARTARIRNKLEMYAAKVTVLEVRLRGRDRTAGVLSDTLTYAR